MPLESRPPLVSNYLSRSISYIEEPSEMLRYGYYTDSDEEPITEIHQLENSKASLLVNLNIKYRI